MINKVKTMLCMGLVCFICLTKLLYAATDSQVSTKLLTFLDTDDLSVRYTTMLLLSHTALSDQAVDKLSEIASKEKNRVIRLAAFYVLASRTMEPKYIELFIKNYPYGEKQEELSYYYLYKSQYISPVTTYCPLQNYLATVANTNDLALEKLISGFYFSDGSGREEMISQIRAIYKNNSVRVKPFLKKYKVDENIIKESSK